MNIAKVSKTAAIVNYVKPGLEMVEMEVEGAILGLSFNTGKDVEDPDAGKPPVVDGGGGISGRSSRARTKR